MDPAGTRQRLLPADGPQAGLRPPRRDERGHDLPDPAMTPYLLAIDNGSQSTKVTIFDARGHAVASARRWLKPYDTSVPGQAVHPGDDVWDSIQHACRDVGGVAVEPGHGLAAGVLDGVP